ncbi:MAG: class I SAM-dependent methyltransferase [Desulfobacterales bacterium]|nr:class I SAM-dependent methyltransferase [Desulfobacterales bacterium]
MVKKVIASDWALEDVHRLWNWYGATPDSEHQYFTRSFGLGIANFLHMGNFLTGRLLDYSSGCGHLLEHLLAFDIEGYAVEFSEKSLLATNRRLKKSQKFKAGHLLTESKTPFSDNFFSVVTLIEVLEHLTQQEVQAVLKEIFRVLAPNGNLLITTPYKENMSKNQIYCPFCDTEFHRMQHMRSIDERWMIDQAEGVGFKVVFCKGINLGRFQQQYNLLPLADLSVLVKHFQS